jgi:integrase
MRGNLPTADAGTAALLAADMAESRLPFTNSFEAKGRTYWFFRSKETGRIGLPGQPSEPEFHLAYGQALALRAQLQAPRDREAEGSWSWVIRKYQLSPEYLALADCTQADYAKTCALLDEALGPEPFKLTTRGMIKQVRDDHAATPRKAHKVKQMASRLYSWADENELVPEGFNPAHGFKRLKRKGGDKEIVPWSDAEIGWVIESAPPHVVTPVMIALYTGQRREDVVGMTWQQWQGDSLRVRTSKTRSLIDMPCHPALKAYLEDLKRTAKVVSLTGAICLTDKGTPFPSANALSGVVRRAVERHPKVPNNRSMHGLRYAAAARMADGGASVAAIEAVLGHRTFKMAMKYASARLRAAQGIAAMQGGADG